ncbi:MAG: hypothetical protein RL037_1040, partial [Bacteroidota bacterium]
MKRIQFKDIKKQPVSSTSDEPTS